MTDSASNPGNSEQPLVTGHLLKSVRVHHGRMFVQNGESILHRIVGFTANGIHDPDFSRLKDEQVDTIGPLGERVRELVNQGDQILSALESAFANEDLTSVAGIVEGELYSFIEALRRTTIDVYALNSAVITAWLEVHNSYTNVQVLPPESKEEKPVLLVDPENPIDNSNVFVQEHRRTFDWIVNSLGEFSFDPLVSSEANDANELMLKMASALRLDVEFTEDGQAIGMTPDHLRFLCSSIVGALSLTSGKIASASLEGDFLGNRLFEMTPEEVEQSQKFQQVKEALFGSRVVSLRFDLGDKLVFECRAPKCFDTEWSEKLNALDESLKPLVEMLALYNSSLSVGLSPNENVVRVEMTLPMFSNADSKSKQRCEELWEAKKQRFFWSTEPEMQHIGFSRSLELSDGACRRYSVEVSGAALLSAEAREQVLRLMTRADEFVRSIPELDQLTLGATGMSSHIDEAFRSGAVGISLTGDQREVKRSRSYSYVSDTFSWEEKAGVKRKSSWGETSFEISRLSFNPRSFFDDDIKGKVLSAYQYADLLQLPCEHDQESEYVSGAEETASNVRIMLGDLQRILGESQAITRSERLKVQVMQCMNLRFAEMGQNDEIFVANIFNENGDTVAKGEFSRQNKSWRVRVFNREHFAKIVERITIAMASLEKGHATFKVLDRCLSEQKIELPDHLVMALIDAHNEGALNEDTLEAAAIPVDNIVQQFIERVSTIVEIDDGFIYVREQARAQLETGDFGVIVDLMGQNPTTIGNFNVARALFEDERYPFFQPNEAFLTRYEQERTS